MRYDLTKQSSLVKTLDLYEKSEGIFFSSRLNGEYTKQDLKKFCSLSELKNLKTIKIFLGDQNTLEPTEVINVLCGSTVIAVRCLDSKKMTTYSAIEGQSILNVVDTDDVEIKTVKFGVSQDDKNNIVPLVNIHGSFSGEIKCLSPYFIFSYNNLPFVISG